MQIVDNLISDVYKYVHQGDSQLLFSNTFDKKTKIGDRTIILLIVFSQSVFLKKNNSVLHCEVYNSSNRQIS